MSAFVDASVVCRSWRGELPPEILARLVERAGTSSKYIPRFLDVSRSKPPNVVAADKTILKLLRSPLLRVLQLNNGVGRTEEKQCQLGCEVSLACYSSATCSERIRSVEWSRRTGLSGNRSPLPPNKSLPTG